MKKTKLILENTSGDTANYRQVGNTNGLPYLGSLYPSSLTITQPNHVGCYKIGGKQGLYIYLTIKPKWFHRKMTKLCLGWEWVDNK
jgi:hypothetical protein